jgi:hypothetical protein
MVAPPRPFIKVFTAIPDFRRHRGTRDPLAAIQALAGSAIRCGSRSDTAMAK